MALFAWLLWGDLCYQMMEVVTPAIIPLKLQHLDAPNWAIALIITTLPGMLNMTVCPWVSFKSDRHRWPRGRRIPYIMSTLPFLCVFLVLLGLSGRIGHALHHVLPAGVEHNPQRGGCHLRGVLHGGLPVLQHVCLLGILVSFQ
ncbi:MAG: hypothetical protein ACKOF3_10680 [Spartobacteria bacterium]